MSIKSIKFYGGSSKGATATGGSSKGATATGGKAKGGKAKGGAKAEATKPAKVSSKRK